MIVASLFGLLVFSSGCQDDDDSGPSSFDLITTVTLTFTDPQGNESIFSWTDEDGAGGMAPTAETIMLDANTAYNLSLEFWDESQTPAVDATPIIREDAVNYYVIFQNTGVGVNFSRADLDDNGLPIGLENILTTFGASSGNFRFELKSQVNKGQVFTTGVTEVNATFPVTVQ